MPKPRSHYEKAEKIAPLENKELEFWFPVLSICELSRIKHAIEQIKNQAVKRFFLLVMSQVLPLVSYADHRDLKLRRSKENVKNQLTPDVWQVFERQVCRSMAGQTVSIQFVKAQVIQNDTRSVSCIPDESVDVIVISPPYGDSATTVQYGRCSKLTLYWLDLDADSTFLEKSLNVSIGSKVKTVDESINEELCQKSPTLKWQYNELLEISEKKAKDVIQFYHELEQSLQECVRILKPGKMMFFVVGNRFVKGLQLITDVIICDFLSNAA